MSKVAQPPVYILVHGTFAQNAEWIRPSSKIRAALKASSDTEPIFKVFEWSGKNTMFGRINESPRLNQFIKSSIASNMDSEHVILAHSHGGNISLRAIDNDLRNKVKLVCLATPVLISRTIKVSSLLANSYNWAPISIWTLVFFSLYSDKVNLGINLASVPVFASFLISLFITGYFIISRDEIVGSIQNSLAFPSLNPENVLFVRTSGDEASALLATAEILGALFRFLVDIPARALSLITTCFKNAYGFAKFLVGKAEFVLSAFFMFAVTFLALVPGAGFLSSIFDLLIAITFLGSIPILVLAFIAVCWISTVILSVIVIAPLAFIVSIFALPIGYELTIGMLNLQVTSEATPPGTWSFALIETKNENDTGLRHSQSYQNDQSLEVVCNWISRGTS